MTYPYVQARWFTPGAIKEYRAIVIHHAEGGGTVGYLANVTRDVSASHVIEYSGRIVQMVKDGDASHAQHTSNEPYTTANYGIYSSITGRAVLGDGWADVNRYVFAIEIEGFRADGPNPVQAASLLQLVTDLRKRFPTIRGLLGHRDVQDKPCPGGKIPWASIGGHGLFEGDEVITKIKGEDWTPTENAAGVSNGVLRRTPSRTADLMLDSSGNVIRFAGAVRTIAEVSADGNNWRLTEYGGAPAYLLRSDLSPLVPGGDPATDKALSDYIARQAPDCSAAELAAAQAEWDHIVPSVTAVMPPRP